MSEIQRCKNENRVTITTNFYSIAKFWLHTNWWNLQCLSHNSIIIKDEIEYNLHIRHDIHSARRTKFNYAKMKFVWQLCKKLFNCEILISYKIVKVIWEQSSFESQFNNHSKMKMQIFDIWDMIFVTFDEWNSTMQKWNWCDKCIKSY